MSNVYNSTFLIESLKRRGMIPENQNTFEDSDFLEILNEEMEIAVFPAVLRVHEDYYLRTDDVAIVSGQLRYEIPYRSTGNKLRDLSYKDNNGNIIEMTRVSIEDISDYQGNFTTNRFNTFFVINNEIRILTSVESIQGSLQFSYYLRPNQLVATTRAATITNIDRTTGIMSLDGVPTNLVTLPKMDFVSHQSPYNIYDFDITPTAVDTTANTLTFTTTDIPTNLAVGDFILEANETIVPQLPKELMPLLVQRGVVHCLEALGDTEGLKNAKERLEKMEKDLYSLVDNRIEGAPIKIVNRHSPLRNALSRGFNRRRFNA